LVTRLLNAINSSLNRSLRPFTQEGPFLCLYFCKLGDCKNPPLKLKNLYTSLLFFAGLSVLAQDKVKYFDLEYNGTKVENCLYNSIKFLDSREDTSSFGTVRVGVLDKEVKVVCNGSFETQLGILLTKMSGETVSQTPLVFQLRRLKFVEKAEAGREYGYCFFRASIFLNVANDYKLISAIDTFMVIESKKEATKQIIAYANKTIVNFVSGALTKEPKTNTVYTLNEIVKLDSIEKAKIKVYTTDEYVNGVYRTFESFKDQTPDYSLFSITFEDGEISEIKAKNDKNRLRIINSEEVYAIVNNGKPYISAEYGYYPLVKNNNDFYFIGDDKVNYIKGQVVKSNSIFNPTEYVYTPLPITTQFEIKIDHVNGKFMRVKEIK